MSTEIKRLPSPASIQREASAWIARLHADSVTPEDRARFDKWRGASASHARAYDELDATWRHLERTGELVSSVSLGQAFNESSLQAIRRARSARGQRIGLATAAAVVAAIGSVWWWTWPGSSRTEFQTAVGEHATVKLSDGSSLELNTDTQVHVRLSGDRRLVQLDHGEAFFQIAKDARRPFDVVTGDTAVRALGTAFAVRRRDAGLDVTVTEGKVQLIPVSSTPVVAARGESNASAASNGASPWVFEPPPTDQNILTANQEARVERSAISIKTLAPADAARRLAWRSGSVYFKEERLGTVIDELSRYTTQHIVIEDKTLEDLSIGGTFETSPDGIEALLATLQDGFHLQVRHDGHTAYVERGINSNR